MTVATTARKQSFTLDAVETEFTYTFRALVGSETDIKATATDGDGVDTELTYTTDYTATVNANGVGGVVTLVDAAAVGSGTLTVFRQTTNTQASDYDNFNQFPADTLENDLDIRTLLSQELSEGNDRNLQLPISYTGTASTTLPTPTANTMLGWDATASAIENKTLTATTGTIELASQDDAEVGTDNADYMSPLRVLQSIRRRHFEKGTDVASTNGTITLGTDANFFDITGTQTMTSITARSAGTIVILQFDGASGLVDGSNLKLDGDFTSAAESTITLISDGTNWFEVCRTPAGSALTTQGDIPYHNGTSTTRLAAGTAGQPLVTGGSGANPSWTGFSVAQIARTQFTALVRGTATIVDDNTVPTFDETALFMTQTITTTRANALLKIEVVFNGTQANASTVAGFALFQDAASDDDSIDSIRLGIVSGSAQTRLNHHFLHYTTIATTGTLTFTYRGGSISANPIDMNGQANSEDFGNSWISITEYVGA